MNQNLKEKENNNNICFIINKKIKNCLKIETNFFQIFIIICLFFSISSNNYINNNRILQENELEIIEIIINITEEGEHGIISSKFNRKPNYVYINETISNLTNDNTMILVPNIYIIKLKWNNQLTTCRSLFQGLSNIIQIDFTNFNTSKVESMKYMFEKCINLKKIIFGNKFDTSLSTSMEFMFSDCHSLISLDLTFFNTSLVDNMGKMFYNCNSLIYLNISNFDTSKTTNFNFTFKECKSLISLDLHSFNTEQVVHMNEMFSGCLSLEYLNISNFNTKLVTLMNKMFCNCVLLTSIDLSGINTSLATAMDMFFYGCKSLKNIDVSKFDTSSCTSMRTMFGNCELITSLNLSSFDTSLVTDMENMFMGCISLISLNLSNFDTSNITSFYRMFSSCESLKSLDISNFNSSQVINFQNMFYNCKSLQSLDLSSFNTEKANIFEGLFLNCQELTSLDLSNFNTYSVTNMKNMFSKCKNLKYLNIKNFKENIDTDTTNMLKGTPDDIIYCIFNEEMTPKIRALLEVKECKIRDCDEYWKLNYEQMIENKKNDINVIYDNCIIRDIVDISQDFYFSNKILNTSIYSYEVGLVEELKKQNSNLTFVEISNEQKIKLFNLFNIIQNETLYVFIYDSPSNDSRTATSEYNYVLILGNGTKLNLSVINEDFYINISIPIRNLDLANFDYAIIFYKDGYDIYNKSSNFYNDICTQADINENDIILKDRKEDIYPNNVTLCKGNCKYKNVDLENKKKICECNLNSNYSEKIDENLDDDSIENDDNFIIYFLDKINYKIFKCYHLLFSFHNLLNIPFFYIILILLVIIMFLSFKSIFIGITNLRILFFKELPTEIKVNKLVINHLKKIKNKNKITLKAPKNCDFDKKFEECNTCILDKKNKQNNSEEYKFSSLSISNFKISNNFINNNKSDESNNPSDIQNISILKKRKIMPKKENNTENITEEAIKSYNLSPYTQALREDKRNIFQITKSFIFEKIDILHLIISNKNFKEIKICQYLLSLLIEFFLNTLLYSDEIVSHKYHNNGKLDFIITLILSLSSNIITAIIFYFIEFSEKLEDIFEEICEIKNEFDYLFLVSKFLKYIKKRIILFIIIELIIITISFYFINIFCIVYNKSQKSLLFNYLLSLLEGLIKSIIVITLIVATRKIGIKYKNRYLFNTSKYIDKYF